MALNQEIYKKYIVPTLRPAKDYIGVEFEFPIVNLDKKPVDFDVIHKLTDAFNAKFGFDEFNYDAEGNIYSSSSSETGDNLSFDCSYNTIEFSFGLESDLTTLNERFHAYFGFVTEFLAPYHHTVTGMGLNPYRQWNNNIPIPNERYRMLLHHLCSYEKYQGEMLFHDMPNFGLLSCASQTHVDVAEDEIVPAINAFAKLEPLKALLFANSPMGDDLCSRDMLWAKSLHGLNPHNVGAFEKTIRSVEELVAYIRSQSIYCVMRDGKYVNFRPTPLDEYFSAKEITGEYFDGEKYQEITFQPALEDLEYLRSFKFEDLTFRGTLELRSVCAQPVSEAMAAPAFHAGLKANLSVFSQYLAEQNHLYEKGYSIRELRDLFVKEELPHFISEEELSKILLTLLDISKDGLTKRGYGEEVLLEPLYPRAKNLLSPAKELRSGMAAGKSLEWYIEEFGRL